MNVFFAKVENGIASLSAEESWHCSKVLRKKAGDQVLLIDGEGHYFEGVLELITDKLCKAKITGNQREQPLRPYNLHIAIAPTKNMDRTEWLLEKMVEIGIDEISFIKCKNSERTVVKSDRVKKIIESAVKQSLQARLPKLNEMLGLPEILKQKQDQKYIAHCFEAEKKSIREVQFRNKNTIVLIGPEGDFTMDEIKLATEHGYQSISLGDNRLRTETAGLFVCQAALLLG